MTGAALARGAAMRFVAVALVLASCTSSPDDAVEDLGFDEDDGFSDDGGKADGTAWTSIGRGVAYQQVNAGPAIVIAYGGYTAKLGYSAAWASELVDARLGAETVGHIYAVQGPADPGYAAREIANTKLRAHLAEIDDGASPIYVVAHSSGSFVAHELLQQLQSAGTTAVLSRIGYANLDGGGSGLTEPIVASLASITFVYARDPVAGRSQNTSTAIALGDAYADYGETFEVTVPSTGCDPGAGWCLHDVVITHHPHDPSTFDLARDYTDFVDRPVTTEYFDQLVSPR